MCDPPIFYPSLQNIVPTPFSVTIRNAHIIYPSLLEYTPPPTLNIYMRHSQNPPSDPKYTPTLNICDPPRIYPSLQNRIPPFLTTIYMRHMHIVNTYMRHKIHPSLLEYRAYPLLYQVGLPESTPPFQNIPPFLQLYAMLP